MIKNRILNPNKGSSFDFVRRTFLLLIIFLSVLNCVEVQAQVQEKKARQIEIVQAGSLEGVKQNDIEVRRLIGNVIFKQGDTYMYCDSALFYEASNSIDAYGTIRIEGPKAKLYGDVLHYEGNEEKAVITGKEVRMTDGKMQLITTALNYDLANDIGEYNTGGKVLDHENVLTSTRGFYYANDRMVFFKDNVLLNNPKYIMHSDTLKYHTPTEIAYFFGPSTINSLGKDSGLIYCENGWYNTKTEKSYFGKNAYINSKSNRLSGDSLLYDRAAGIGRAWNNVQLTDTVQKMIVGGDYAFMNEKQGKSFVTGKSTLTKIFSTDSLFIHADTLYAIQDTAKKTKSYFAYHHVRIFKTDLQGQCDSLVYSTSDSTIHFFKDPILWNEKNQLTAEHIRLQLDDNKLKFLFLTSNSFIAGLEDSIRFDQIKGRDMVGFFSDNKLYKINVTGNGQSVYYVRNKKQQLTGVNKADCSDMVIYMNDSKVQKISLLNQPDATMYPIQELPPSEFKLRDFVWYGDKRPVSKEEIYIWK
jgi:lipopolysaccharide export system protein LptA